MDLKKINELLSDLTNIDDRKLQFVERSKHAWNSTEEDEQFFKVFRIVEEENLYLKLHYYTDSYGGGRYLKGVEFVRPVEKKVISFEKI